MTSVCRRLSLLIGLLAPLLVLAACGGDGGGGLDTDYPSAGEDRFELTHASVEIEYTFDSVAAVPVAGALERIELQGPTLVTRSDPQDKDGDGRVEVATEIVEMELTGTASFGPLTVSINPDKRSTGMVEQQQPGKDFPADSFFDVFVQVELPSANGGNNVIGLNEEPLRMEAELSDLPPGEDDEYHTADGEAVPLVSVNDATLRLGRIVDALHIPNPAPGPGRTPQETPQETPTEEPAETPTEETLEPTGVAALKALVALRAGCEHTQPGVESDLVALILLEIGVRAVDSWTVEARAEGAGVINPRATGVTAADGTVELRFPINQFGTYDIMVEQVIGPDGQPLEIDPASQTSIMVEVGEVCNLPAGF